MKLLFTIIAFTIFASFTNLNAQDIKRPLTAKVVNEVVPTPPSENLSWVKGHWNWDGARYSWLKGEYVDTKEGAEWIDGEWERDQNSGWWKYNDGYWRKVSDNTAVNNNKNTADSDKAGKEKRQQNKSGGFFIKTTSPK